jgi:FKBP-type peptidyl-prolyl cis-trans isomerase
MELVVKARNLGKFLVFEIAPAPAPAPKPAMHTATETTPSSNSKSDVSYAVGMNLAAALREQLVKVDVDSLISGLKDSLSGAQARMTGAQAMAALNGIYIDPRMLEQVQSRQALGEKNKRDGEAFLAENKRKEGVVTLPTGLQYKVLKVGEGKKPSSTDVVKVQYRGTFINGKEFENTFKRGASSVPVDKVIRGWSEALQLMPVGSKWQLFVPSDLAYGERGAGGHGGGKRAGAPRPQVVGPNQTLVFDLELVGIQEADATPPASDLSVGKNTVTPEMLQELVKAVQAAQTGSETRPEKHEVENQ